MRNHVATTSIQRLSLRQMAMRVTLSLAVAVIFLFLLRDRIGHIDTALVITQLASLPPYAWLAALGATCISFWAIGQYDVTVHRHLATGVPAVEARRAGIAAIAVSQTIGAGVVTGALLRWRCLKGISLWQATLLSGAVALSFLGGWAVITSLAVLTQPHTHLTPFAIIILVIATAAGLMSVSQPIVLQRFHLPNLLTITRILSWTAVDTIAAAAAFWLLLPVDLAFATVVPAFLLAFGAGLISGSPAGVGAFEVTLLALLPQIPDATLLAAVLGWRMVYYALPAMLGALAAGFGPSARSRGPVQMLRPAHPARAETLIAAAQRAETALVRQGHLSLAEDTKGARLIGRTPHSLVALFDPIGPASLPNLHTQARAEARLPALYKTSPRTAALARQSGWHVVALGSEARLCPLTFSTDGHTHATLRRKLRKAQNAGILVEQLAAKRTAELAAIARLWRSNRRERGFSIGQFDVAYLATQRVYVARTGTRIVGFISLHDGPREWTLDLMRHAPDAPDGTMHALILQAVADARTAMIPCLSLAAAGAPRALPKVLRKRADAAAAGLLRFKQSFAPHWQPLYLCAPTRFALCVATVEIIRAINWPAPIHPQDHHAQYGFAPTRRAWQRKGVTNP